jgi:glucose/arabinose dehydrogenase/cytochrome c2
MRGPLPRILFLILCTSSAGLAWSADASLGKTLFTQRCAICHSAEPGDNGGAQGPSLIGVFNRPAASTAFAYTNALKASRLTWNAATLNRFLAAPGDVVPGGSMVLAVPENKDRADLVAYFESVKDLKAAAISSGIPAVSLQSANWRLDAPGKLHRIDAATLPAPFATPSTSNSTSLAPRPANADLKLPPGFHIATYRSGFAGARKMLLAPNGDVLLTETNGGRVTVLHPSSDGSTAVQSDVYVSGLKQPFGIAFYPNNAQPQWLYVAATDRVVRYPYQSGDTHPRGEAETIAELPSGGGHITRDIAFSPDGKQLFVSVGSASNVAEQIAKKSPDEIRAWESAHGLGAAWGNETNRAAVLAYDATAPGPARIYASGIRNCVSLTMQPSNGALWCTTNERDLLGDDLVPDYSTRVKAGEFFGWPWYYVGSNEDPRHAAERPDLKGKVSVPDVLYQSHSAALSMTFYQASSGKFAFPSEYVGDAIVGFHGSWNRSLRTGYKLVRVHMKNGNPVGDYEDFLTGFVVDDNSVWGRPVATAQLADGSLLMSEDGANVIYRIWYAP